MTLDTNILRTEYADITLQFNKLMSINQRIMQLLAFINENFGLKSQGVDQTIQKRINEKMKELDLIDILRPVQDMKQATHVNGGSLLDQNEVLCRKYLKKLIDAEKHIADLSKINEDKFDSLSDVAKEMVQAKLRIKELNDVNEKLEQENILLRINSQSNYIENAGKYNNAYVKNSNNISPTINAKDINVLNSKIEELNNTISNLKSDNSALQKELDQVKATFSHYQSQSQYQYQNDSNQNDKELNKSRNAFKEEIEAKENEVSQCNNKINILNESMKEKENIIVELKNRITDLERIDRNERSERTKNTPMNDSSYMKSPQSSKRNFYPNESKNDDEFTEYLNKSTDDCLKELNNQMYKKVSSRNLDNMNTSNSNIYGTGNNTNEKCNGVPTRRGLANNNTLYCNNNRKAKMKEEKKDLEVKMFNKKVASLQNEEGENEEIGITYIGDLFLHLYNQARLIEKILE